jgi:hypothetical protein
MKNKVYEITYMYELENQEYVDKAMPDLGIKVSRSLTERCELAIGKTPAQAITNWEKKVYKREPKANVYIIDIKEYNITTSSEE